MGKYKKNKGTYFGSILTVDLTYWPSNAKKESVFSEWNCFSSVIQPVTNGGPSKGSVNFLHVKPPIKRNN